jgi:soluble lytic murein transglycosylase
MPRMVFFFAFLLLCASPAVGVGGSGSIERGIIAYRAGEMDSAITLLAHGSDNPYLDAFRLYYRADCFVLDSMYGEAKAALDTLFELANGGTIHKRHRIIPRARNLYIEALAQGGAGGPYWLIPSSRSVLLDIGGLSCRACLFASRACFEAGDSSAAMRYFIAGAKSNPSPADTSLFRDLLHRYEVLYPDVDSGALGIIARSAAAIRLFNEANLVIGFMLRKEPDDAGALLCEADVLSLSGELGRALSAYWRIFYSAAPVELKRVSLYQVASIEYRLKRFERAAEHFRMYGMYYPGSESAARSLDTAARIYVLRKEWKRALAIWTILRERHRGSREWSDASLSEAALRSRLGMNAQARKILRSARQRTTGGQSACVLYWLMRTSATDIEKAAWSESLLTAYPRSFYAAVLRDGEDAVLSVKGGGSERRRMSALVDYKSSRAAGYDTIPPDSVLVLHPAFAAYEKLLEAGLGEEAEMTGRVLASMRKVACQRGSSSRDSLSGPAGAGTPGAERLAELIQAWLFKLYAEAVRHGLDAFSMSLLTYAGPAATSGAFPWELWYPVSYVNDIQREAESHDITPLILFALIREESRFDPRAVSVDGARGLMQLMPATAAWICRRADSIEATPDVLFDASRNIAIGCSYLDYLLSRFDGSLVGALAAYNGGEGRMAAWKEIFGVTEDPLAAIEMIGPRETRQYVKKVLESLSAYRAMTEEQVKRQ